MALCSNYTIDRKRTRATSRHAFTRLELAALLAVISLLIVIIYPALGATQREDKSAVCTSNLRQIGVGMLTFASDNDDRLYTNPGGSIPNYGQWFRNPASTVTLPATDNVAYWGIAYFPYVGRSREVFRCPSAKIVDERREEGLRYPAEFWLTSTYGISGTLVASDVEAKIASFPNPATTVFSQDAAEHKMEGPSDSIGLWPGQARILAQWGPPGGLSAAEYNGYDFTWEWYRHEKRCNTLWLSGHVSRIPFSGLNVGIDYRYYTGETPALPLPGE